MIIITVGNHNELIEILDRIENDEKTFIFNSFNLNARVLEKEVIILDNYYKSYANDLAFLFNNNSVKTSNIMEVLFKNKSKTKYTFREINIKNEITNNTNIELNECKEEINKYLGKLRLRI